MVFGIKSNHYDSVKSVQYFALDMTAKAKEMQLMPWEYDYALDRGSVVFSFIPLAPPVYKLSYVFLALAFIFNLTFMYFVSALFFGFKIFWTDKFYFYMIKLGLKKKGVDTSQLEFMSESDIALLGWFNRGTN